MIAATMTMLGNDRSPREINRTRASSGWTRQRNARRSTLRRIRWSPQFVAFSSWIRIVLQSGTRSFARGGPRATLGAGKAPCLDPHVLRDEDSRHRVAYESDRPLRRRRPRRDDHAQSPRQAERDEPRAARGDARRGRGGG